MSVSSPYLSKLWAGAAAVSGQPPSESREQWLVWGIIGLDVRRTERPLQLRERALRIRSYTLAKTIVQGLSVLMTRPVGVSIPFVWLIRNGTIVSVVCCSLNPSSAFAA